MKTRRYSTETIRCLLLFLFIVAASGLKAQKEEDRYAALVREVRNEVWAMDLPGFKDTTVPEKYKNAPAVILAAHNRLEVMRKTKIDWWGAGLTKQQVTCRSIYRQLIYINSQSALEEMSQFSFLSQEKERYTRNEQQRVLGIRILKSDGTIKEIEPEEYMETDESGQPRSRNTEEKWKKLAVPGLEMGDIIDLFFARYTTLNNQNPEPYCFRFMEAYPLLTFSVHCEIDPKLSTFYRCLNGAPDFNHTTNSEGNHILDLQIGDSGRTIPDFWYNDARQTPTIVMYLYNTKTPYAYMPPSAHQQGLHANPSPQLMIDDARAAMKNAPGVNWSGLRSGRKGEIAKALKARQTEGWSEERLMDYLYQYCYYRYMENGANYTPASFVLLMHDLLEKVNIPHQVGITTKDTHEPLQQLINYSNTTWFIYLEANGKCYAPPACYAAPGELPASLQGAEAILGDNRQLTLTLATAGPEENLNKTIITAAIDDTYLHIQRREEISGALKEDIQPYLVLDEDLYNSVGRQLGITTTIYDETKEKFHADLRESYRRSREQEKERYRNEIIGYHGSTDGLETHINHQLLSIGNRMDSATFAYQVDYTLSGCVKKAGPDYVLSVGRLIGDHLELKSEQRLRKEDIYREMARCYQWDITIQLPKGFRISPEGLKKLNVKIENECGTFSALTTAGNGTLNIKAEQRINHKIEPVSNWKKFLEIIDATKNYETMSVVLQSIQEQTSSTALLDTGK